MARVAIIGGGVSGLATAYYLGRRGIESIIIEKSNRLGGLIQTDSLEGCRLEAGPDSYLAAKPEVNDLAVELGDLSQQIIPANDAARRVFIVRSGKLVALPKGMTMMVPGERFPALTSELFSLETKLRFLLEPFSPRRERCEDFSVGELVCEHFGREVLEYVAGPLLAGIYGGDAAHLSAESVLPRFVEYERRYGSLISGVRREKNATPKRGLFLSFRDGMQSLTDSITEAVTGTTTFVRGEAKAVCRSQQSWEIEVGGDRLSAEHLVLACPAHVSARLLEHAAPELSTDLAGIPYSSAILVTLLYDAAKFRHPLDGFGFLVPAKERRTIAAATWVSRKFPARIASGLVAIRAFLVGDEALRLSAENDAQLGQLAVEDFRRLMDIGVLPHSSMVHRWPDSMPQYVVGHKARHQRISRALEAIPSLHLVGNAYNGVGIPDCIRLAQRVAWAIAPN
ncbi:MAG: protoporphyrinogen oxidase [Acidobacteriaceae bacterium]|nr:protoporphyrinogen oxidase [Acidobacteriaceae bacterium]